MIYNLQILKGFETALLGITSVELSMAIASLIAVNVPSHEDI